jgi:hypothetical protein
MVIDEGQRGLEQSQHHPLAGVGAHNALPANKCVERAGSGQLTEYEKAAQSFKAGLVSPDKFEEMLGWARTVLKERDATRGGHVTAPGTTTANAKEAIVTLKNIEEVVQRAVKAALAAAPVAPKTYAAVAGRGGPVAGPPPKVVPLRQIREVIVRGASRAPELEARTPLEVVAAVNNCSGRKEAVGARKLQSGDMVVTFRETNV